MNPGALVTIRANRVETCPNHELREFRNDAAAAIRDTTLDPETTATVWALLLAVEGWPDVAGWVRLLLGR